MSSGGIFDLSKLASELQSLEEQTAQPDFWKDPQAAARVGRRKASLERDIQRWREIERKLDDLQAMADLAEESGMLDDATGSNAEIELRTAIQPLLRNLVGYYSSPMYDNIIFWFEPRPTGVLGTEDMRNLKRLFQQDDPTVVFMEYRTTIGNP